MELYFLVRQVTDLRPGVYHYAVPAQALELLNAEPVPSARLTEIFMGQGYAGAAALVVVLTIVPARSLWQYADCGYRLILLEAGLNWHRDLVRHKWRLMQQRKAGRPATDTQIKDLVLRLAEENPTWGYSKIHRELLKLGFEISRSSVRNILRRQHVPPAPQRSKRGS
jgi:hypothetical protein